jgi:hypothetical protein
MKIYGVNFMTKMLYSLYFLKNFFLKNGLWVSPFRRDFFRERVPSPVCPAPPDPSRMARAKNIKVAPPVFGFFAGGLRRTGRDGRVREAS